MVVPISVGVLDNHDVLIADDADWIVRGRKGESGGTFRHRSHSYNIVHDVNFCVASAFLVVLVDCEFTARYLHNGYNLVADLHGVVRVEGRCQVVGRRDDLASRDNRDLLTPGVACWESQHLREVTFEVKRDVKGTSKVGVTIGRDGNNFPHGPSDTCRDDVSGTSCESARKNGVARCFARHD